MKIRTAAIVIPGPEEQQGYIRYNSYFQLPLLHNKQTNKQERQKQTNTNKLKIEWNRVKLRIDTLNEAIQI